MRSLLFAAVALVLLPQSSRAADTVSTSVLVTAQFSSRTSLKVSTGLLEFAVDDPARPAVLSVDFEAAARTAHGADVMLSVEPLRALEGPGGAADAEAAVHFDGTGDGTLSGSLVPNRPSIAGRWNGSGRRTGRLVFSVRAEAAGVYTVPVRFVLTAP